MNISSVENIIRILDKETKEFDLPLVGVVIQEFGKDPYLILIACLLSLRVKDSVTVHVCRNLFARARTPEEMIKIPRAELETLLFKTGFYRNKTTTVHEISMTLLEKYKGKVPDTMKELLSLKGVGAKTANLVMGVAFDEPAICVDTHVHKISNRLGLISTNTVEETEVALKKILPQRLWVKYNKLMVMWGQNICVPVSPKCTECAISSDCKRISVRRSR